MACLVLGTESCSVYILDPEAFTIMDSLALPAPPVLLSVAGQYDVEYRIVVACRSAVALNTFEGLKPQLLQDWAALRAQARLGGGQGADKPGQPAGGTISYMII